jgi:hypothetical protein
MKDGICAEFVVIVSSGSDFWGNVSFQLVNL